MKRYIICFSTVLCLFGCTQSSHESEEMENDHMEYKFPFEDAKHEGTWVTWPHPYTYGEKYRSSIEPIWSQMVKALHTGEKVHIVAYDEALKARIIKFLKKEAVSMKQVDFVIAKSDDIWIRDTGPIYVYDKRGTPTIIDFGFDGWGEKAAYLHDNDIPKAVAKDQKMPIVSVPNFILEGGAVELDGAGTMMACKSSVISANRNQDLTMKEVEEYAKHYLGVTNIIWLDGVLNEDITDAHIDGMARFYDEKTILTVSENDFFGLYEGIKEKDYVTLITAHNGEGILYEVKELPMTKKNVKGLKYKGSYLNYYVANDVVLLPIYQDEHDNKAIEIIKDLYQDKQVVPIDVTALYRYGGMIHCITQQQPIDLSSNS